MPDPERMRYEIARNIFPTIINQCYREAHTNSAYRNIQQTAAEKTILFTNALVREISKKGVKND